MSYTAETVANAFITISNNNGKSLTNMQLQKLVYIANGYSLALINMPLIEQHVHAWQYGPVYPKLYKKLSQHGSGVVKELIPHTDGISKTTQFYDVVLGVWNTYSHLTGGQLSALTHAKNTPWSEAWSNKQYSIIPELKIKDHFNQLVNAND